MEEQNKQAGCGCKMCQKWGWCPAGKWHKILWIVIFAMIISSVVSCAVGHERKDNNTQINTIVVSGKGEIAAIPDIATVSFSVMEENMDVSKASDAVNKKMTGILATLKADGIAETDIKTTGYNINPRYIYVNAQLSPYGGKQVLAGYDVTQSIEIKIKDLSKAGKTVTDLGSLNVTDMSGLNFTNDKYDDLVKQARNQAIVQARADAESLAKSLGVRLVKIVGYSEGGNYPVYYDKAVYGMGVSSAAPTAAVLPAGENKITSNVSVTYEIR